MSISKKKVGAALLISHTQSDPKCVSYINSAHRLTLADGGLERER